MALKTLLVALTTSRAGQRVRFAAGSVVDLTAEELELLDNLTVKTGKAHFRDPLREGGAPVESKPEIVHVADYAGQDVPVAKKTVEQLKALLTFSDVAFDDKATKADLLDLALGLEADPDAGL